MTARPRTERSIRRRAVVAAVATLGASLGLVALPVGPVAAADFGAGNVVVVRMGDGSGALSSTAAPEFLDEYSPSGVLVQTVALPTTVSGSNRRLTDSGSATSTGSLNRSADGRYLTLAGYDAAPGTAGVVATTSAATNRVIARVGADGVVDTSTALSDAYSANNIRGVVTDDGSHFWTAGTGTASFGGVRYTTLGASASTQVTTAPTNVRTIGITDGQLYAGSGSSPFIGVSRVGTGLPTGPATATSLFSPSGTSPYGFVLLDRDPAVPGVDSAYLADDSAGLLKYSFDGSTWTARGSLAGPIRGLTGVVSSGAVQLYATSSSNALLAISDTAGYDQPMAAAATTIATAAANTAFRGVAFAPQSAAVPSAPAITAQPADRTISAGATATLTVTASGSAPLAYQWYAGASGDTATPVGDDEASFTTPALTATASYWVRVSNAVGAVDSSTATITVQDVDPGNTAPTVTPADLQPLALTVGDPTGPPAVRTVSVTDTQTDADDLTVTATNSSEAVATVAVSGAGATRSIAVTPVGVGYSTITVKVSDGDLSDTATLRVAVSAALPAGTLNHYGISDASAAIDLGDGAMVLADDETNVLRVYSRTDSRYPTSQLDLRTAGLALPDADADREVDLEAAARTGNTVYWLGSQGQNSSGNTRLNRRMLFSTTVNGTGPTATLSLGGSYPGLRDDLVAWDTANGGTYGLAAAAARAPESSPSGLNLEGAEFAPDGTTLFLAFRGPLTSAGKALIVPVTNPAALVAANPTTGVTASFGTPIELDLGGRGIRDIRKNAANDYLIVAGPTGAGTGANGDFSLYSWNGTPTGAPLLRSSNLDGLAAAGSIESIVDVPAPLTATSTVQLVTDSGDTVWYGDGVATKDLPDREFMKSASLKVGVGNPPACTGTPTPIPAVQGSGQTAAITGPVTVRGVVVGDYEGPQPALRGFYLQDPTGDGDPATSDGIFVFDNGANSVSNGQVVEVTGTAAEFQDQTQITASSVDPCPGAGPATVEPVDVTLPVASATTLERYEGMLVRFHQTLTVTEHFQLGRFGQVVVSSGGRLRQPTNLYSAADPRSAQLAAANALNRLIVDDATQAQNPDPIVFGRGGDPLSATNTLRGGDTLTDPVGVLTYTWAGNAASGNAYRLRPIGALGGTARFEAANARPTAAPAVGGSLKVASANLLNFFNTFSGCTFGLGGPAADCRGAGDSVEFERQAAKEVAALTTLDADVVGVMEMENDGYGPDSAIQELVNRLNAATAPGTWAFVNPDAALGGTNVAGDDAIKVGLLYRPARVTPVPGTTAVDLTSDAYERHPLAQTFVTPDGARASVVVNHFKSKGCDGATGANLDSGDGQGCFNARRVAEAHSLAGFISGTVIPGAGDPDVLIIGDLNSYAKEDPIAVLEAAGYVNLVEAFGGPDAYSYAFDGTWGYLDHALASASLRPQATGAGDYHINADEPSVLDYNTDFKTPAQIASLYAPDQYRTSDHDSIRVGLNLAVTKSASTTAVTSSVNPATLGQSARYTATVTSAVPGLTPTGTVRFYVAGVPFGAAVPVTTAGTALSASLSLPLPSTFTVEARYSGSPLSTASIGRVAQRVQYGLPPLASPAAGSTVAAGAVVPVRFTLTDSAGRPLPDAGAQVLALTCQVKVSVSGAQTLAPVCARYDAARDQFIYDWRTARSPMGAVQLTVTVPIAGGAAQTRTVTLTVS